MLENAQSDMHVRKGKHPLYWCLSWGMLLLIGMPYALLILMSLGSGWTFPHLVPDQLDLLPWRRFLSTREGMLTAVLTSVSMSLIVGTASTLGGLIIGRTVHFSKHGIWRFLVYLPFVISPIVIAICLYDLLIRLNLAGTFTGVILVQTLFALAFAAIFFSEMWDPRIDRLELLVNNFGGNRWQVWQHAILPQISGLILICFIQTALFAWLDYGLVSVVGGGHVASVTTRLFSYIREANVNQAAQSSLVLLGPALAGVCCVILLFSLQMKRETLAESQS
ncbi:Binding-protein-dependent transport system inner membrane component [Gimesia panareensis]|uniref:Binding-protein-dependent transport system inner membrane component n=1 Tax=Gimesia panareensis TaxID=2527978 RepID=A0A518FW50_9PLAN|nr:ABC transporter permease subunit [Gimesia panareensis]QDV20585.1 Binding-protein-dependent transport system inner membrane component [Gimesia panareensis]